MRPSLGGKQLGILGLGAVGLEIAKRLGDKGLFATLYAGIRTDMLDAPFMRDFLLTAKDTSFATLEGVSAARG